ncbi:MAG: chorismate mutase [Lachnospiraceae bacterium]|nr:chorismate mutase [Lachnospiraceae bacterium]MDE6981308.1 chorismate mutase [Lachnospiraceae bacterium]
MGLEEIRKNIDAVDTQMRELFLKRMELSRQVAEEKKRTGAKVYVPKREEEVILCRAEGVTELAPEYRMFLKELMAISRTYQYSCLDLPDSLEFLSDFTGGLMLTFTCSEKSEQLLTGITALKMAGIIIHEIQSESVEEQIICRISLWGDFRLALARGAVLQIYEENENVSVQKAEE